MDIPSNCNAIAIYLLTALYFMNGVQCDQENACKMVLEKRLTTCCKVPETKPAPELERVKQQCRRKVLGEEEKIPTDRFELKAVAECLDECFYQATNRTTEDLKPLESAVISYYEKRYSSSPPYLEVIPTVVKECTKIDLSMRVREGAKCKSALRQFAQCITAQFYLNCPSEYWNKERAECKGAKDIYRFCISNRI